MGWGDGLPLVPPTREAVARMLKATSRSPSEVIGKIPMKSGTATIEKIAINAVMAGAKPEYFPVIIAAMEAFEKPKIIIAGGYDKGLSFEKLGKKIAQNAKAVVLIGQSAEKIAKAVESGTNAHFVIRTASRLVRHALCVLFNG